MSAAREIEDAPVRYEVRGPTAWITLDRPEKLNAVTHAMYGRVGRLMRRAGEDDAVLSVVLHGNGRAFSAGYDLSAGRTGSGGSAVQRARSLREVNETRYTIFNLPKPTIAMVQGYCIGGACDLALACDLILASDDASFGFPEVRYGGGEPFLLLPYLVGPRRAKELLFTGDRIDAREAERIGLVNHVVPLAELEDQTRRLCEFLTSIPLETLRAIKAGVNRVLELQGFTSAVEHNVDRMTLASVSIASDEDAFARAVATGGVKGAVRRDDWRSGLHAAPAAAE
jgi:enoyl-CoA hydratase